MRRRVGHPVPKIVKDRDVLDEGYMDVLAPVFGTG
jgi:hypothetical protein